MILVAVPDELEEVLWEITRDRDGVDASLREKLSMQLDIKRDLQDGTSKRVAVTPSLLAQAVPHVRRLRSENTGHVLHLLRGGSLIFPDARESLKRPKERKAYEARRQQLLLNQEHREYARMTSNVQRAPRETVRDIQESFKFQAGMGANMVLAVGSAFIIGYWASKFVLRGEKRTSQRLVVGLVAAIFMLLVELMVFVLRSIKADEAVARGRQEADETHTDVGVHRAGNILPPRRGGRGVLDGISQERSRGEYEMVPPGIQGDDVAPQSGTGECNVIREERKDLTPKVAER